MMRKKSLFLCLLLVTLSLNVNASRRAGFALKEYLVGEAGSRVCITTSLDLGVQEEDQLVLPAYGKKADGKHYVFVPGRADHAGKTAHVMKMLAKKGHVAWCIDPYGQGGSDGGVLCQHYDESHEKPCCRRKGHGTWEDYAGSYMRGLEAIRNSLSYSPNLRGSTVEYPDLNLIAHSQGGNVDMWSRLHSKHGPKLKKWVQETHYIAPMVSHTLFLRPGMVEETARFVLSWVTWAADMAGYGENDFLLGGGPINPFELTPDCIADKVHASKRGEFIKVCQLNPKDEIGKITNGWFWAAQKACQEILKITPKHFKGKVHVHIPGDDQVVYPQWVRSFFEKTLQGAHTQTEYPDEPHALFWGSKAGVDKLVENIITGEKQ